MTGPALCGKVWVSTTINPVVRHVAPDCGRLSNANTVHGPLEADDYADVPWCGWCAGHADTSHSKSNERSHVEALKRAARGD